MSGSGKTVQIEMPGLGGDAEGEAAGATLATWLVSPGDPVKRGDVIAELETDKATVELESPADGAVAELAVAEGTEGILPGVVLGTIAASAEADAEPVAGDADRQQAPAVDRTADHVVASATAVATGAATVTEPEVAASETQPPVATDAVRSTPLARRAASANRVDLSAVAGTGPGGRVVEADVVRAAEGAGASAAARTPPVAVAAPALDPSSEAGEGFRVERLSAMRKTIARRLSESKQQVPHFYLRTRVRMDPVVSVRAKLNAGLAEEGRSQKISVNDFIVRAAALALRDVPRANVQYADSGMCVFERVDVSVAVATDGGLVTPVVRDADRKGLTALSTEIVDLARLARAGQLSPDQYQGGTLTISNLGMYGIETVYPILNPPQACIVGVGAAEEQPVVRDGQIEVGRIAAITLAADHRAVDGAVGAEFLAALRERLEDPLGMML